VASQTARMAYDQMCEDIRQSNKENLTNLAEQWETNQTDIAERRTELWDGLADNIAGIEENLVESIASEHDSLNKTLAGMDHDRERDLKDFAEHEAKIARDAAAESAGIERDRKRSLADIDKQLKKDVRGKAGPELQAILEEGTAKKQQVEADARQRQKEASEKAAAARTELAEKRADAKQEFDYRKQLAIESSNAQIAQMEKQATKQEDIAMKAAAKQEVALDKMLAKQDAAYEKAQLKEQNRVELAQAKAAKQLEKADVANPMLKALDKLGINLDDFTKNGEVQLLPLVKAIMEGFQKLPAGVTQSSVAFQLFGRSGGKFLEWLHEGTAGLDRAKELIEKFGLAADSEKVHEYGVTWAELGYALDGVKISIGNEVLPLMTLLTEEVLQFLIDNMPAIIAAIKEFFQYLNQPGTENAMKSTGDFFGALVQTIGALIGVIRTLHDLILAVLLDTIEFIITLCQIENSVDLLLGEMAQLAGDIMGGLIKGITDQADAVRDAILGVITGGIDAVKQLLGIASPSQLFRGIGANMAEGMIQGFSQRSLAFSPVLAGGALSIGAAASSSMSRSYDQRSQENNIHIYGHNETRVRQIFREMLREARWA